MTPSSCAVSSLDSLITTQTLINLSAFFPPRHERWGDFFSFFSLISACSFQFKEGKVPCRHVGHFSFPVFNTTRLEDDEIVRKLSPCSARIWKRKMMHNISYKNARHRCQITIIYVCFATTIPLHSYQRFFFTPKRSKIRSRVWHHPLFLAFLLYQFGEMQKAGLQQE